MATYSKPTIGIYQFLIKFPSCLVLETFQNHFLFKHFYLFYFIGEIFPIKKNWYHDQTMLCELPLVMVKNTHIVMT